MAAGEVRFVWDPRKAELNLQKHGVGFAEAIQAFFDPLKRVDIEGHEHGEIRWRTVGEVGGRILVVVSHTTREEGEIEVNRIISARKAGRRERQKYEEAT